MINFSLPDNVGGSAEVFRTVGEKWKGLTEESKKEYRKKALEAGDNIPLSSNKEQALKIMKNMMKEVYLAQSLLQKICQTWVVDACYMQHSHTVVYLLIPTHINTPIHLCIRLAWLHG